jgi:hypothetical protein
VAWMSCWVHPSFAFVAGILPASETFAQCTRYTNALRQLINLQMRDAPCHAFGLRGLSPHNPKALLFRTTRKAIAVEGLVIATARSVRTGTFLWTRSARPQKCPKQNGDCYKTIGGVGAVPPRRGSTPAPRPNQLFDCYMTLLSDAWF